jgi:hypothetical protein
VYCCFVAGPFKCKKTNDEARTTNNGRRDAPFRDRDSVISGQLSDVGRLEKGNEDSTKHRPNNGTESWVSATTETNPMYLVEDNGI